MRTALVLTLSLAGCHALDSLAGPERCPPGFTAAEGGCVFDEDAVVEVMRTFDQGQLVKVNTEPFLQYAGPSVRRNVWVSPVPLPGAAVDGAVRDAVDLYLEIDPEDDDTELSAEFPVGTLIVHETVDREEGHTVQVKLGPGYADENGRDWWFGKYYDDGTPDENECTPCVYCHNPEVRPGTDGLWGVPG